MFLEKRPEFARKVAQQNSANDAELMERWELRHGHTWLPSGWWIVLVPVGLWIWWGVGKLALHLIRAVFGL